MPYCTISHVEGIIAQALTSSNPTDLTTQADLLRIGKVFDRNQVPTDTVEQYITWADEDIDGKLSVLYVVPLCEQADFETTLFSNIDSYNDFIITSDHCPFGPGDTVIIIQGINSERYVIDEVISSGEQGIYSTTTPIALAFEAGARVVRVKYPAPITQVSARLAAANIYDKHFASQSSPNESEFGKFLRRQARQMLNNVLNGRTKLHGQQMIGRRFLNPTLPERYDLPGGEPGSRDMDDLS